MKKKYGKQRKKDSEFDDLKYNLNNTRFINYHNRKKPQEFHECSRCKKKIHYSEYGMHIKKGWFDIKGYRRKWHCRKCDNKYAKDKHSQKPEIRLFNLARRRAKNKNLEFNLTKEYIKSLWPQDNQCPIQKKKFKYGLNNRNLNPTIDRILPKKGYIIGNIIIVSHRVNECKSDIEDIEILYKIYLFYKKLI